MDSVLTELTMLSDEDKKELAEKVLDELGISVRSINRAGEMVIPCTVTGYHNDQDKNPTAALNYRKLLFNCLGCEASGTLLWLVAETLGLEDSQKALSWVKDKADIEQVMDISDLLKYFEHVWERPEIKPIPTYSPQMLLPWLRPTHKYFGERHISVDTAMDFFLGYNPDTGSIVIPHFFNGDLVGWQTRRYRGSGPKYKNSTDFPRESTIYNYQKKSSTAIVVESAMSVLRHESEDFHLEATFGANVTDAQIALLAKHERVVLWMDNDKAGWAATHSMRDRLAPLTNVWAVQSHWKQDPGDLPSNTFQRLVRCALPASLWRTPEELDDFHG